MSDLVLDHVVKKFRNGVVAVQDLSLQVPDGELLAVVGPSGCGKSTLLRLIAGLEDVTGGSIAMGARDITDVPAPDRDVAMVFQSAATFPYLDVFDNIAFGLKLRHRPRTEIRSRVTEVARAVGLDGLLDRMPSQLSGGQRQRVAIGRAMLRQPKVFLMDEPLSSLDARLRVQMRAEIGRLQRLLGTTMLYVTHDQSEAMTLGDRIAVMDSGRLVQVGTSQELYHRPTGLFVASFIGSPPINLAGGTVDGRTVEFAGLRLPVPPPTAPGRRDVVVGVRPTDLAVVAPDHAGALTARIDMVEDLGSELHCVFAPPGAATAGGSDLAQGMWTAVVRGETRVRAGDSLTLGIDWRRLYLFDPATGEALSTPGPGG